MKQNDTSPSLLVGSLGAMIAGALGMAAWYVLIKTTGYEIGIAAWGIGALIGFAALWMAKGGSDTLGMVAGGCALVAIIGGQFLVTKNSMDDFLSGYIPAAYAAQMEFAQKATVAESDDELRRVLAEDIAGEGGQNEMTGISAQDLAVFRADELPELREFIEGNPSEEGFGESIRSYYGTFDMRYDMMKASVSLFTVLWLFLGVGSAYKIARRDDSADLP